MTRRGPMPEHWHINGSDSWYESAACKGMPEELFFPPRGGNHETPEVCNTCPVQSECLAYALNNRIDHGIWGGKSEKQRLIIAGRNFRRRY